TVPVRDDRRRSQGREDRGPRGADVPAALHGQRHPQLLLEGAAAPRALIYLAGFRTGPVRLSSSFSFSNLSASSAIRLKSRASARFRYAESSSFTCGFFGVNRLE